MNTIQLPNLLENPNTEKPTIINEKQYAFIFRWLDDFCSLDIKIGDVYLLRGRAVTTATNLISRVKNDDLITGSLYLINKYGYSVEPTQENFHTDYYLVWME